LLSKSLRDFCVCNTPDSLRNKDTWSAKK
jgi:hypothetical protein